MWSYKTPPELRQQEEDWQVGREYPTAGLLVSRKRNRFPTVVGFLTMLLLEPAESRQSRGSGRWSWGWRVLGEKMRLHGDWSPQGKGGHKVHLQVFREKVQQGRRNSTLIKLES